MFVKSLIFFIGFRLAFIDGVPAFSVLLPWSHEADSYISLNASAVLKNVILDEVKKSMGRKIFPKAYFVRSNFFSGNLDDSIPGVWIQRFIELQETAEERKKFFEGRMEIFDIPDDDPRTSLRGQRGVRAKIFIKKNSFLGVVPGILLHTEGGTISHQEPRPGWGEEEYKKNTLAKIASLKDSFYYLKEEINQNKLQSILYQKFVCWRGYHFMLAVKQGKLGPMNLINETSLPKSNVSLRWVKFSHILSPFLLVISTTDIKPGEELLQAKSQACLESEGKNLEKLEIILRSKLDNLRELAKQLDENACGIEVKEEIFDFLKGKTVK